MILSHSHALSLVMLEGYGDQLSEETICNAVEFGFNEVSSCTYSLFSTHSMLDVTIIGSAIVSCY